MGQALKAIGLDVHRLYVRGCYNVQDSEVIFVNAFGQIFLYDDLKSISAAQVICKNLNNKMICIGLQWHV